MAIRPNQLAQLRRAHKQRFLTDRVAVERRTGAVDFAGTPRDDDYAAVDGLDSVPCRIVSSTISGNASPSQAVTREVTDLNVNELSALFPVDVLLEVGDRLSIDDRVYRVRGLQDDVTDLIFVNAQIERLRDE